MVPFPPLGSASTLMLDLDIAFFGKSFTKRVMEKNGFLMAQPKKRFIPVYQVGIVSKMQTTENHHPDKKNKPKETVPIPHRTPETSRNRTVCYATIAYNEAV